MEDHIEILFNIYIFKFPWNVSTLELFRIFKGKKVSFLREPVESWWGYQYKFPYNLVFEDDVMIEGVTMKGVRR